MTIHEAIAEAKEIGYWTAKASCPTSIDIEFLTLDGTEDSTQLDLYDHNKEKELSLLWANMCDEFDSSDDLVTAVYTYGFIVD